VTIGHYISRQSSHLTSAPPPHTPIAWPTRWFWGAWPPSRRSSRCERRSRPSRTIAQRVAGAMPGFGCSVDRGNTGSSPRTAKDRRIAITTHPPQVPRELIREAGELIDVVLGLVAICAAHVSPRLPCTTSTTPFQPSGGGAHRKGTCPSRENTLISQSTRPSHGITLFGDLYALPPLGRPGGGVNYRVLPGSMAVLPSSIPFVPELIQPPSREEHGPMGPSKNSVHAERPSPFNHQLLEGAGHRGLQLRKL
jgi:hypothetical protein